MKTAVKAGVLATGLLLFSMMSGLGVLGADRSPVLLQSLESRTRDGGPVFNRIAWFPGWKQDVWVMQQSHAGLSPAPHSWDRLAIVVDKTQTPKIARFYQLEPGRLAWDPQAKPLPFRATCFMCHSNGPRAIRPDLSPAASAVSIGLRDRLRLALWNARVKTYGRVLTDSQEVQAMAGAITPLRYPGPFENEKLPAATCRTCHNEAFWGRGSLTRQNFMSIGFMVEKGFMPPPGFRLPETEKDEILRFVRGLPVAARSKNN
jgi:hypothetical protein